MCQAWRVAYSQRRLRRHLAPSAPHIGRRACSLRGIHGRRGGQRASATAQGQRRPWERAGPRAPDSRTADLSRRLGGSSSVLAHKGRRCRWSRGWRAASRGRRPDGRMERVALSPSFRLRFQALASSADAPNRRGGHAVRVGGALDGSAIAPRIASARGSALEFSHERMEQLFAGCQGAGVRLGPCQDSQCDSSVGSCSRARRAARQRPGAGSRCLSAKSPRQIPRVA